MEFVPIMLRRCVHEFTFRCGCLGIFYHCLWCAHFLNWDLGKEEWNSTQLQVRRSLKNSRHISSSSSPCFPPKCGENTYRGLGVCLLPEWKVTDQLLLQRCKGHYPLGTGNFDRSFHQEWFGPIAERLKKLPLAPPPLIFSTCFLLKYYIWICACFIFYMSYYKCIAACCLMVNTIFLLRDGTLEMKSAHSCLVRKFWCPRWW